MYALHREALDKKYNTYHSTDGTNKMIHPHLEICIVGIDNTVKCSPGRHHTPGNPPLPIKEEKIQGLKAT